MLFAQQEVAQTAYFLDVARSQGQSTSSIIAILMNTDLVDQIYNHLSYHRRKNDRLNDAFKSHAHDVEIISNIRDIPGFYQFFDGQTHRRQLLLVT